MDLSSSLAAAASASAASPSLAKAVDTYRKAVGTAATLTAYTVLARGMARELVPHDLRAAVAWAASLVRARFEPRPAERRTVIIRRRDPYGRGHENRVFADAHSYLATKIDPRSMTRFCLSGGASGGERRARSSVVISMVPGDSMTDVFEGVEFTWTSVPGEGGGGGGRSNGGGTAAESDSRELSFDAEHTDTALDRYVPFIRDEVERARRRDRELEISMNEGSSWNGIVHHHPATFDTVAMDPALKKQFDFNKSQNILLTLNEEVEKEKLTLSGLLNFIDGLWSTSGEERVIVFTTNYRERLDPALLRPGRMDKHVYMGHCGWDAFTTLARNYFLVDDHPLFPEIRRLISQAEVTPAEVSEMLLRSEDAGAALAGLAEFLEVKKKKMNQAAV
ncbi:LOW QUALITY PROTEIN: AAA-ATPase At5g17760 [Oryza sativa Japonica Group]|uniref:LOW QUALITY PROTEIN: AAA-ATPase At5g17760 n=1 Tax=Oryza sativa subsp. japonica TaxID=39947 RepID=UPI00339C1B8A